MLMSSISYSQAAVCALAAAALLLQGCNACSRTAPAPSATNQPTNSAAPNPDPNAAQPPAPEAPAAPTLVAEPAGEGQILRRDPAMDTLVAKGALIEKIASGFGFVEGPIWFPDGRLWFSDIPHNLIRQWTPDGQVAEAVSQSGYEGQTQSKESWRGSNGLAFGKDGDIVICQHGNRRIAVRSKNGVMTTLVDRYQGRRLNSPNDLVYKSDGALYFTDPPYGLAKGDEDPLKELSFNGVFRYAGGRLTLLTQELTRPNGIAFSPDEKTLYVANSDAKRKVIYRFPVAEDGTLGPASPLVDLTAEVADGLPDGLKVDAQGNVWATGPGGVWVISPEGKVLGQVQPKEVPANLTFGDDGKTLYLTARTGLYRLKTEVEGKKPFLP